jgi:hypothetical protein
LVRDRVLASVPETTPTGTGRLDDLRWDALTGRERVIVLSLDFVLVMGSLTRFARRPHHLNPTQLEPAKHIDEMVLFSGDGDFRPLVEAVERHGVRVTVVSSFATQPPMIVDELRRQADAFID